MKDRIYLDYAATTPVSEDVMRAMTPYFRETFGNPSSIHGTGREAHRAVDRARKQVAEAIGANHREIFFTSGGSESDNWALCGAAFAQRGRGNHIITTAVEHHAVLNTCRWLEKQGFRVTYLPVDACGRVDPDQAEKAMDEETVLISVMTANNEIGTLEPIREIGEIARRRGVLFHTDAVQAVGAVPVNVRETGVDMLSLSAHKFYGPKGVGALYIREGVRIDSLIHGGEQEGGLRAGTENLSGIIGLGEAIRLAVERMPENARKTAALRDRLIRGIIERLDGVRLNGHPTERLPNNCSLSFRDIEGEALLLRLDLAGIAASSGSACASGSLEPSHVLTAIGLSPETARGSLRMTLGAGTTEEEIDEVIRVLPEIVEDLRSMRSRG